MRSPAALFALAAACASVAARPARAADFEVQGDTTLQAYEVASPWGDVILDRRRFMQTVGVGIYNIQGQYHPGEADYRLVLRLRLDADFGINANLPSAQAGGETNFATGAGSGVRFIPGLQPAPVDLMYGYVEGRNIAHGLLGFRVGRQYLTDVLGWWSFDGALVKLTLPVAVDLEAYGGLEQRGGLPLSTPRFEAQGVWRGSHQGFDSGAGTPTLTDYPSFLDTYPAPAFGFTLNSRVPSFLHVQLAYRQVYNTGPAITGQFPEAVTMGGGPPYPPAQPVLGGYHEITGIRISQEKVGGTASLSKSDLGVLKGGMAYDLYAGRVASAFGSAEAYLGKRVTVGADGDYFVPTFDADSIFNWFTHGPITTATGRVAVRVTKRFQVTASGGARLWWAEGDPTTDPRSGLSTYGVHECTTVSGSLPKDHPPLECRVGKVGIDPAAAAALAYSFDPANRATSTTVDGVGNLNARYRFASGDVALKGMVEAGARGKRDGADLSGEKRWDGGRWTTGARASLYAWSDPTRPDRDAVSFGYVLAGGFRPFSVANLRLEWEHDTNRLVGQRYRVAILLNVRVLR